ncbi:hypothetical protein RFI_14765 [Reticulomyxa filosa]|uniref:Uncharacterized protein n=1 Tax=Reticulomyxa filosa TaxID=46433 RepID=X6N8T6_RETFI|nr:hypothetical protein RFI_14765 [Reticulomyxa filosa]|eukprot:ETO22436.1 hypothetical protein RFI_14765 [Reticulomyxa filosa]
MYTYIYICIQEFTGLPANDAAKVAIRLFAVIHGLNEVSTPTFDLMLSRRKMIRESMGILNSKDEFWKDDEVRSAMLPRQWTHNDNETTSLSRIGQDVYELSAAVNQQLSNEKNPQWFKYSNEFEESFAKEFIKHHGANQGFAEHAELFNSMTLLSRCRRNDLKKAGVSWARPRRKMMRVFTLNWWSELQNIIKYGEYPYMQSNGTREQKPSPNQVWAEMPYRRLKNPKGTPAKDAAAQPNELPNMFFLPFKNFREMKDIAFHNYNPATIQAKWDHKQANPPKKS